MRSLQSSKAILRSPFSFNDLLSVLLRCEVNIPSMAKQQKLDWKSLLDQKLAPSSVTKRSSFLPPSPAPATPGTPLGSNSSPAGGVHDEYSHQAAAIPFLLLPVAIPESKHANIPLDKPADELLTKLAELKRKTATLVDATGQQKPPGGAAAKLLEGPQILLDPLPPAEHVYDPDSFLWCDSDEEEHSSASSRQYVFRRSNGAGAPAAVGSSPQGHRVQGMLAGGPSQSETVSHGNRMATSLTYQCAGSSLITTANSPGLKVQQALARIRQLQNHTQEAFQQGDLFGDQLGEEVASQT